MDRPGDYVSPAARLAIQRHRASLVDLRFAYQLHSGIVDASNALRILEFLGFGHFMATTPPAVPKQTAAALDSS
ncbi:MAG: hypothetical protein A2087_11395 [Spirochaetes bacterium GWD1_61_31]|nr:MAG: hypothetical protein A2Y37_14625 [Spirochaetes bacterium GWB1_60_80]OHD31120.1 MAG: hypothetical protein A2004_06275 [Spirochaetes bacterium GWC1_61_12]OHD35806.1 MAG: hypothetical protein A2087_11395 [Spirochaetes bacterium GWD1_61_31]OHD61199.1 MAG: hypothetical protein A2Y32_12860 [Spirochaetes bacterium GWF1_60_12]HAP43043.1 hypothetical protein [Spirochaetaceae bacterium]